MSGVQFPPWPLQWNDNLEDFEPPGAKACRGSCRIHQSNLTKLSCDARKAATAPISAGSAMRVDYALTPLGRSLADALVPLCTWGNENMAEMATIFAQRDTLP